MGNMQCRSISRAEVYAEQSHMRGRCICRVEAYAEQSHMRGRGVCRADAYVGQGTYAGQMHMGYMWHRCICVTQGHSWSKDI
jgi:hypothetical protein